MVNNTLIDFKDNEKVVAEDDNNEVLNEIYLKIKDIKNICYKNSIPMFFTCVKNDDGKKTEYYSEMLSAAITSRKLADDKIAGMSNVLNGFMTVPPHGLTEIEFFGNLDSEEADFIYDINVWGEDDDPSERD